MHRADKVSAVLDKKVEIRRWIGFIEGGFSTNSKAVSEFETSENSFPVSTFDSTAIVTLREKWYSK
jgi:hypothetical protein